MNTTRPDLFTPIHKGIRALLYQLGADIQRTDAANAEQRHAAVAAVNEMLDLLDEHGMHEDTRIFPALARFEPELAEAFGTQHERLHRIDAEVRAAVAALTEASTAVVQRQAGERLRLAVNALIGEQMLHMNREEEHALPALWAHLGDDELIEIREAIIRAVPPDRYRRLMTSMLPAMHDGELVQLMTGITRNAPEHVRTSMMELAMTALGDTRYRRILLEVGAAA